MVHVLQRALQGDAVVTQSKFLRDRGTGEDREVDVVVEAKVGPYPLTISFECSASTRPADVQWVECMVGKHHDLPTNKLILVSQCGFTAQALAKAEFHGAQTLALRDVAVHPWAASLAHVRKVFLVELRASVLAFAGQLFRGHRLSEDTRLRRADLDVSVRQLVDTLLASVHPETRFVLLMREK